MCLTENPAAVCRGSICQVLVLAREGYAREAASDAPRIIFASDWPTVLFLSIRNVFQGARWMLAMWLPVFAGTLLPGWRQDSSIEQQGYREIVSGAVPQLERPAF